MVAAVSVDDEILGGPGLSNKDAQLVSRLLRSIRRSRGQLKTEDLLKEVIARSRPKSAPTHHLFEWNAAKGHALYLLERARRLVVAVRVVFIEAPEAPPVRAYPVRVIDGNRGPMPMREVLSNKEQAQALLEEALELLERLRVRYAHLTELNGVFRAMDKVMRRRRKGK
jgi:hypothetical protein